MKPATARPKITVTADGRGVASHAGTRLLAALAGRIGLTDTLGDALAQTRRRRSAHDPGRVLTDRKVMLVDGGRGISGLAVLRTGRSCSGRSPRLRRPGGSWTTSTVRG